MLRLVRKEPLQPAISGFFGVAVAAFIAYRTGSAKGFFLFGIYASLIYCGIFVLSVVVRWPIAGVVWNMLNGTGQAWRADKPSRYGYDVATLAMAAIFAARFVVQTPRSKPGCARSTPRPPRPDPLSSAPMWHWVR